MIHRRQLLLAAAGATGLHRLAWAQPIETNRVLCGFPAGGTTDAVSRRIAEKLRPGFAKMSIVENKPGAGGRLAVEELKRSAPDGSTLLLTPAGMITLYPHIYTKLPYGINDVAAVCTAGTVGFAFAVGPGTPESVKTLKDFLAWAKTNPAQANYGSPGPGTTPHFVGALLSKESGVALNHVPYRGSAPGIQDLLGGQIPAMSSPIGDYLPHMKSGKLRVLATSGGKRSRFAPDAPTYTELGFPALEMQEWYGFFLPARTPADVVERAAQAIHAAVAMPDVIESFASLGVEAGATTPAELSKALREETARWEKIVKRVGFIPEA